MIHILVIDDDLHMRTACTRVLSRAGWSIVSADTGDEGLEILRSGAHRIDVVLMDQIMPGLSGMEALVKIHAVAPGLPVIIMTGSATDESASEIRRKGAFDCLAKPFTPEQLRDMVLRAAAK